jgi:hypothetical protein
MSTVADSREEYILAMERILQEFRDLHTEEYVENLQAYMRASIKPDMTAASLDVTWKRIKVRTFFFCRFFNVLMLFDADVFALHVLRMLCCCTSQYSL